MSAMLTLFLTASAWQPKENPLPTRWAAEVTPENVHAEYPRPQLVRDDWLHLNSLWDFALKPELRAEELRPPARFDRKILVPFPVESALSGVMERVGDERIWYRRTFSVPSTWTERVLLHFGAVDWDAVVWINGVRGGGTRAVTTPSASTSPTR